MIHAEAYLLWNGAMSAVSLLLGGKLAGLSTPRGIRLLLCALLSGGAALAGLYVAWMQAVSLAVFAISVRLCYGREGNSACFRCGVMTVCAAFLLGGAADVLGRIGASPAVRMSISALTGLLVWVLCVLLPTALCEVRQVEIIHQGRSVLLPAMLDTGNLLRDPITAKPVLVASYRALRPLFPDHPPLCDLQQLPFGFRLLTVRTAAGKALWPVFRPDGCRLYLNGQICEIEALVAVAGREYNGVQALVPQAALPSRQPAMTDCTASSL